MTASVFKKVTVSTSVNLNRVKDGPTNLKGWNIVNATQAAFFIKLYWHLPTDSVPVPVVGTTVPNLTIQVTNGTADKQSFPEGVQPNNGNLFYAVTTSAGDGDTNGVSAGGILGILYE